MPRFLIKADRTRDLYMEWTTVADGPVSVGNRAHYENLYGTDLLDRTDTNGTSTLFFDHLPATQQEGGWDDSGLIVEQRGFLRRDRFAQVAELMLADINATIPDALLDPLDDDNSITITLGGHHS